MTYKQQQTALLKLKRIVNTIQNDKHLFNILKSYTYVEEKAVKIDSDEYKRAILDWEVSTRGLTPILDLLNIFNAELDYFKSKKEAYIREEKIKTILK